ncbi:MAG: sulfatase [Planctomycetaceae bacterium]|jgi:arylsulfatase A-like enzyme|nr:sulfatase [Planctomycetaceae bacterium]
MKNIILPILLFLFLEQASVVADKPNILFIAVDDMRDWVGYIGTHPQTKTPNIDRLASQGVAFTRAYCAAAVCNSSRTALLTGLRPSTTGVYENQHDWRKIVPQNVVTLQQHFQQSGYETFGSGKIYHGGFPAPDGWDDYLNLNGKKLIGNSSPITALADEDDLYADGVGGIKFRPLNCNDEDMTDYHVVQYGIEQLQKKHDKPFFLAVGLIKPHMAWNVPRKYYDLFPLDKIILPEVKENDLDDVPPEGIALAKPQGDHANILKSGRWKNAVQGYLAAIAFSDAQIGRLLDAFEKSEYKENTIVVFWSDHGWHLGEKEHWRKFALWEEANRAPLIWKVPGLTPTGVKTDAPVDFMHIYPTLCDLAGIPLPAQQLEGKSIRSLLANPEKNADTVAVMTYGFNNHAVRTKNWRYIRYNHGGEELYDEQKDPKEWNNLAVNEDVAAVKKELSQYLPKINVPDPVKNNSKDSQNQRQRNQQY